MFLPLFLGFQTSLFFSLALDQPATLFFPSRWLAIHSSETLNVPNFHLFSPKLTFLFVFLLPCSPRFFFPSVKPKYEIIAIQLFFVSDCVFVVKRVDMYV